MDEEYLWLVNEELTYEEVKIYKRYPEVSIHMFDYVMPYYSFLSFLHTELTTSSSISSSNFVIAMLLVYDDGRMQVGSTSRLFSHIVPSSPNRLYCAIIPRSSCVRMWQCITMCPVKEFTANLILAVPAVGY